MPNARLHVFLMGLTLLLTARIGLSLQQAKQSDATSKASTAKAQPTEEIITNDSVIQLLKVGIDEDMVISKIQKSKYAFDLSVNGMVSLKQAGVSDRLMHFLMDPTKPPEPKLATNSSPPPPIKEESKAAVHPAATSDPSLPTEIGTYAKKDDKWVEVQPELVTWKTGGVLKNIATVGIVKGDVNGLINGAHSRNYAKAPMEFLIVAGEGVAITEYQLLHMHEKKDTREFRTVTGGVLHVSGGATRDLLQFEGNKIANRTFIVKLPTLGAGEYGFLPPGSQGGSSTAGAANIGKMYTFRVGE